MRRHAWIALTAVAVLLCAAVAFAGPTKPLLKPPPPPPPTSEVDVPIDNDCLGNCCESSGGDVQLGNNGYVCHVDDEHPNLHQIMATFFECANGCTPG